MQKLACFILEKIINVLLTEIAKIEVNKIILIRLIRLKKMCSTYKYI